MPSMGSRLLGLTMSALGGKLGYRDLDEVRRKVERQRVRPAHFGPPQRLQKSCTVALSFEHGWPCYEIAPRGRTPKAQVLYLHGGAFIDEAGINHWALVKELTCNVPACVVVPVYPLAPAETAETVLPALTALARTLTSGSGLPAVFMGDSAGGGLALAAAQRLRDEGEATADRLVLISPWLDALLDDPVVDEIQPRDPMLAAEALRWTGALWAGALSPSDPAVSPLNGSMAGLPPAQVRRDARHPARRRQALPCAGDGGGGLRRAVRGGGAGARLPPVAGGRGAQGARADTRERPAGRPLGVIPE